MGQPKGKEEGTRTPVDLRIGPDLERFVGVQTERDPGSIDRNAFQRARNVRLSGGMPVARGGQEKVITTPISGAWDGLCDVPTTDAGLKLYFAGTPIADAGNFYYDPIVDRTLPVFYILRANIASSYRDLTVFRFPKPIPGEQNLLYRRHDIAYQFNPVGGVSGLGMSSTAFRDIVVPGEGSQVCSVSLPAGRVVEFLDWADGDLLYFQASDNSTTDPTLYFYVLDMSTATLTLLATIVVPGLTARNTSDCFTQFGTDLTGFFVAFAGGATPVVGEIVKISSGVATTTDLLAVEANTFPQAAGIRLYASVFNGKLYIPGYNTGGGGTSRVYEVDAGVSSVTALAPGIGTSAHACWTYGSLLYVLATVAGVERVLTFDGAAWVNLGAYGGSATPGSRTLGPDGRIYEYDAAAPPPGSYLTRSGVGNYLAAFSVVGLATTPQGSFIQGMP